MSEFTFRAASPGGGVETGTVQARSRAEAYETIRARKLRPLSIEKSGAAPAAPGAAAEPSAAPSAPRKLSAQDLLFFTEELAELLESGLQLEPALQIMEGRKEKSPIKAVAAFLRGEIRDGTSFSSALRRCGNCFSELYCGMAAAGEAAGALPEILRRQAEYFAVVTDLKRRVVAALVYPSVVFCAAIGLMVIFMTFLLPQLTDLLARTGAQLPLVTRVLIGTSELVAGYWWAGAIVAGLLALAFFRWKKTPTGKMTWGRVQLSLPLAGPILHNQFLAEFSQTLATLVQNGVTLLGALRMLSVATANVWIREMLDRIAERVGEGASLSAAMRKEPIFPDVLLDIVRVGEQTGDLGQSLGRAAKRFDREFGTRIARLATLIQPFTIFVVATFVGLIAYSMITGILSSVSSIRVR